MQPEGSLGIRREQGGAGDGKVCHARGADRGYLVQEVHAGHPSGRTARSATLLVGSTQGTSKAILWWSMPSDIRRTRRSADPMPWVRSSPNPD